MLDFKQEKEPLISQSPTIDATLGPFPSRGPPLPSLPVTRTLPHHPCLSSPAFGRLELYSPIQCGLSRLYTVTSTKPPHRPRSSTPPPPSPPPQPSTVPAARTPPSNVRKEGLLPPPPPFPNKGLELSSPNCQKEGRPQGRAVLRESRENPREIGNREEDTNGDATPQAAA